MAAGCDDGVSSPGMSSPLRGRGQATVLSQGGGVGSDAEDEDAEPPLSEAELPPPPPVVGMEWGSAPDRNLERRN